MLLAMKGQQRAEAIQALMGSRLSVAQAAQLIGLSERQVWRPLACARKAFPSQDVMRKGYPLRRTSRRRRRQPRERREEGR